MAEEQRNNPPKQRPGRGPGHGPPGLRAGEKPKNFKQTLKKFIKELNVKECCCCLLVWGILKKQATEIF